MDNNEQGIGMEEKCAEQIIGTSNENATEGMQEMSSSSMDIKNASEEIENKEQKSTKKSLRFGGWLPDVLDWYKRPELVQTSLPTSSLIFHQHCYRRLHGKRVKPRIVRLVFTREKDNAGNWQTILRKDYEIDVIPIADINPPDYIIGFEKITFCFIGDQILQFMEAMLPLLNEVKINFELKRSPQIGSINRMMEVLAPKTNKLEISPIFFNELKKFNQQFPNFIPGLQSICLQNVITYTEMMEAADLALKWLTTPREDGKPKMFEIRFIYPDSKANMTKLIERVKEEFIRSTEPANFIIRCRLYNMHQGDHEDFEIQNESTKEMLELQRKGTYSFFLVRHKNDSETTKVDWWEQMKLESNTYIRIWNWKY